MNKFRSLVKPFCYFVTILSTGMIFCTQLKKEKNVRTVANLPINASNTYYTGNRSPLMPNPFIKMPTGSVQPQGWLLKQLELMRDGFVGHMPEISRFLKQNSGWLTLRAGGWEEMPYWLRGYLNLAYLVKDRAMLEEAKKWIESVLNSQDADGWFGPNENKKKHDIWPNMIMIYIFRNYYEMEKDNRILPFMTKYFQYQNALPDEYLLPESWQKFRGGENLDSIYWLYNHTGDSFLLDLAKRVYARTYDWYSPIVDSTRDKTWEVSGYYHGVNISMAFRYPALFYQQSGNSDDLHTAENNYRLIMGKYGQPGGMFAADENIRPGYNDPRQGVETCSMVEMMFSHESLLKITGNGLYADRCEEIAYNNLPASVTPDWRALHYLTPANIISCDTTGEHYFDNQGDMVSYNPWRYRCCQHNISFGWPYFIDHMWLATRDNGIASVLFAPSSVKAQVGQGEVIRIHEETQYPFGDWIEFTMNLDAPVRFPFYIRIPGWCSKASILINGHPSGQSTSNNEYFLIDREWQNGDIIRVQFRMDIEVKSWPLWPNTVSIKRGPLWYSLKIKEKWDRFNGTDIWPAFQVTPDSPWNFGLLLDNEQSIRVKYIRDLQSQPFDSEYAPIVLDAPARQIDQWKAEGHMIGKLPLDPTGTGKEDRIELIPMGCTRLRLTVFPLLKE